MFTVVARLCIIVCCECSRDKLRVILLGVFPALCVATKVPRFYAMHYLLRVFPVIGCMFFVRSVPRPTKVPRFLCYALFATNVPRYRLYVIC